MISWANRWLTQNESSRLVLATYSATYQLLLHWLRCRLALVHRAPEAVIPYVAPFIAGTLASTALLIEGNQPRRITLALYALSRALQYGWAAAAQMKEMPRALAEGRWWFNSSLVFA